MRRRVFNLLCMLSVALLVAMVALTIRSVFIADEIRIRAGRHSYVVGSFPMHVYLISQLKDESKRFSFEYSAEPPVSTDQRIWVLGFFLSRDDVAYSEIPLWALLPVGAPLPVWWLVRTKRHRKRLRAGLCVACGYDLRASTERCPECGTPIAPRTSVGADPAPSPSGRGLG
jgi:hypothetical protein